MNTSLIGRRFGLWRVIRGADGERAGHDHQWHCECHCGNRSIVSTFNLTGGNSRSCGCSKRTQGGLSHSREYVTWAKMIRRCHVELTANYRYYGARGIYVCARWRGSFLDFLADVGPAPSSAHTLDRENTAGSYTCGKCGHCKTNGAPANHRWATKAEQSRNMKTNRYYTHDGRTMILKDWAKEVGIKYHTLWYRLKSGLPFAEAIAAARYARSKAAATS